MRCVRPTLSSLTLVTLLCACPSEPDGTDGVMTNSGITFTTSTNTDPNTDPSTDSTTDPGDGEPSGDGDPGSGGGACVHQCQSDADCLVGGMDQGYVCVDSYCTGESSGCSDDNYCVAFLSGWTQGTPCSPGGGECDAAMQVCLDLGPDGVRCAVAPSQFITCDQLQMDEIPMTDADGNPAIVCGRSEAACHPDGYCHLPCAGDQDCLSASYPICNVQTGLCECGTDADCQTIGQEQFSACNGGLCGCGEDQQCVDAGTGDVCTQAGFCGCSADAACVGVDSPFDSTLR